MGKKLSLLVLIGCLLLTNFTVYAEEKTFEEFPQDNIEVVSPEEITTNAALNPSLTACVVEIGIADNGLHISFDTTANQPADEIGVKNIVIKEKRLVGWKDITVNDYCTYNSDLYAGDIVYTGAVEGKTYYVECTHYAIFDGKEITLDNYTGELTYN